MISIRKIEKTPRGYDAEVAIRSESIGQIVVNMTIETYGDYGAVPKMVHSLLLEFGLELQHACAETAKPDEKPTAREAWVQNDLHARVAGIDLARAGEGKPGAGLTSPA